MEFGLYGPDVLCTMLVISMDFVASCDVCEYVGYGIVKGGCGSEFMGWSSGLVRRSKVTLFSCCMWMDIEL